MKGRAHLERIGRWLTRRWLVIDVIATILLVLGRPSLSLVKYLWKMRPAEVHVFLDEHHQTMTGWEYMARASELDKKHDRYDGSWLDAREEIIRVAVEELGLNRIRIEILSGAENPIDYFSKFKSGHIGYEEFKDHFYEKVNDNADPENFNPEGVQFSSLDYRVENFLLPMRRLMEARGEKLIVNLCYVDFGWTRLKGSLSHAEAPEEYAELIFETFRHLKEKYHVVPEYFEVILEPDNTDGWRGEEIGRGALAAMDRLRAGGFSPRVIVPSTSQGRLALEYFDAFSRVPGAAELASVMSYHRYDYFPDAGLLALKRRADELGLEMAMLEHTVGDVHELHTDLTVGDVTSWQAFNLFQVRRPSERLPATPYLVGTLGEEPHIELARNARLFRHYFKNIRRGAVRLGASTSNPSKRAALFRNVDGRIAFVLDADAPGEVTIHGLPEGEYVQNVSFSDAGEEGPNIVKVGADSPYVVHFRDAGVMSFLARAATVQDGP